MATYSTIKKGSKGDSVRQLQELLNANGYNLASDGIYGSKTAAAVKDYQSRNGLSVDGITGNKTWSSLYGGGNTGEDMDSGLGGSVSMSGGFSGVSSATSGKLAQYEEGRPEWAPSKDMLDLKDKLDKMESSKPGAYQSKYQAQIDGLLDKILNRDKFSYNFNADPLYQQYKDRYTQQGKMAMQDTMAQAAALSGGYGNSYAQTVGQQAYQGYLQGLNDVIPELRNQAYEMYQDEGNNMKSNLNILQGLEDTEYGKYRDTVNDYWTELNYFYNKFGDQRNFDFNKYSSDLSAWQADRAYWYQKYYDEQQQANWAAEFGLKAGSGGGGGGGGGGSTSGGRVRKGGDDTQPKKKPFTGLTEKEYISNIEELAKQGGGQEYRMWLLQREAQAKAAEDAKKKTSVASAAVKAAKNGLSSTARAKKKVTGKGSSALVAKRKTK